MALQILRVSDKPLSISPVELQDVHPMVGDRVKEPLGDMDQSFARGSGWPPIAVGVFARLEKANAAERGTLVSKDSITSAGVFENSLQLSAT